MQKAVKIVERSLFLNDFATFADSCSWIDQSEKRCVDNCYSLQIEQTLNKKLGFLHVGYFGPKLVDWFVWKMLSYHVGRKMKRSPDKWRQSLARLWWTPSMVSCFMNRLKHVWLNCDTVEDWLSARCLDELGWTQSNWLHSIYDKTIIMSFWYWGYFKTISKWCQAHMLSVYEMLNPMSRRSERSNW